MISRTRHALVLLVALLALGVSAASAQAIIPVETSITTPAGTTAILRDLQSEGPAFTVSGEAIGVSEVDIRCYYGDTKEDYYELAAGLEVTDGKFSAAVPVKGFGVVPHDCRLRAVPSTSEEILQPAENDEYSGPLITPAAFEVEPTGYEATTNTTTAFLYIEGAEYCGLESSLYNQTSLEQTPFFFYCNGGIQDNPVVEKEQRPLLTVDGAVAYGPTEAENIEHGTKVEPLAGAPKLTIVSKSYDPATADMTITERDPFVSCSPEPNAIPTETSCTHFTSAGVTLERSWTTSSSGHLATMRDVWRSTDGKAHAVTVDYYNELEQEGNKGVFEFPGSTSFAGTTTGTPVTLPAGPGAIYYKYDSATPEGGNGEEPQGAIVYDRAPTSPLVVQAGTTDAGVPVYDAPYTLSIAAGGEQVIRMAYLQEFSLVPVRSEAAAVLAGFAPSVSIGAPANGATLESESPTVTVSGTAADSGALASVSVDGSPASLTAGGAWSATATLKPGANTITATATDQAGLTATATVTVDYKIPPGKATLAGPITTNNGNVTFTLKCTGASGAVCTVKDSLSTIERRHKSKLLGLLAKITKKTVTVASGKQTIAAGKQLKITLTLNKTGKALLKQFHKLPGKLTVTIATATTKPTTAIAKNITITPPKPKKKKHKH